LALVSKLKIAKAAAKETLKETIKTHNKT